MLYQRIAIGGVAPRNVQRATEIGRRSRCLSAVQDAPPTRKHAETLRHREIPPPLVFSAPLY